MADKPMKIPGPDHPISIDANPSRVAVTVGGKVIADTRVSSQFGFRRGMVTPEQIRKQRPVVRDRATQPAF